MPGGLFPKCLIILYTFCGAREPGMRRGVCCGVCTPALLIRPPPVGSAPCAPAVRWAPRLAPHACPCIACGVKYVSGG